MNDARLERWRRRAHRAFDAGDFTTAARACQRLLKLAPDYADAAFTLGVCILEEGRPADALARLEQASSLEPDRADFWAQQARCLAMLGRLEDALAATEHALDASPKDAVTHDTLGAVLTRGGRLKAAGEQFAAAAELAPDHADIQYHHANALIFSGETEKAAPVLERVLELNPAHARAHLARSDLLDGPPPEGRIEELEQAIAAVQGDLDRELTLGQALARTLEAAGETARAMQQWEQGKSAKKQQLGYTIDDDRRIFEAFESLFTAADEAEPAPGEPSSAPIFVLGMPRTGTTLAERMLASHSRVVSGGELNYLPQSVREAGQTRSIRLIDLESLPAALAADPASIGRRYLELCRTVVGDAEYFVDKLPLNFFYVGFIRRALPNAKIVCLRRGALDACLASYRQLFRIGYPYYSYALSLDDAAEYYAMFDRLMAHWDALYPGRVYRLQYEALVSDTETEVRRLFEHLEMEFEPSVLEFDKNASPVATASAAQVRQPVYKGSVGAWQRYRQELEPVRRRLEELGIDPEGVT